MDGTVGFCHRCSGRTVSDGVVTARVAGNVKNKEVVMLYDSEHVSQLLSGATLAGLPESSVLVEPTDQSGKSHISLL